MPNGIPFFVGGNMKCPYCEGSLAFLGYAEKGKEVYWCAFCGTVTKVYEYEEEKIENES